MIDLSPTVRAALVVGVIVAVSGTVWTRANAEPQDSLQVSRLQQEIANLRFQFDFEMGRLQREIEQLRRRVQEVEFRRVASSGPPPPIVFEPAPLDQGYAARAERFVVHDADGRPRAVLGVSKRFGPMLTMMNEHGDVELMLSANPDGPRLELFDDYSRLRVWLGLDDNAPELALLEPDPRSE